MRFYSFTNANYMSQLQLGLQTAHCVAEMADKYDGCPGMWDFQEWARAYKTIVILNGGNCADLTELYEFLDNMSTPYSFAKFNEDEASLNNAITCVGIILPEEVYETARLIRSRKIIKPTDPAPFGTNFTYVLSDDEAENDLVRKCCAAYNQMSDWEIELINRLNRCGLA